MGFVFNQSLESAVETGFRIVGQTLGNSVLTVFNGLVKKLLAPSPRAVPLLVVLLPL